MVDLRILLGTMVWMVIIGTTTQFLFDNPGCVASPPCACAGLEVFCYGKNMNKMPPIRIFNSTAVNGSIILNLANNEIEALSAFFFQNLSRLPVTEITLYLQNNAMDDIKIDAFKGIEDKIIAINLDSNNLTDVPTELAKLSHLRSLYFTNNPISTLGSSLLTLRALGRSLTTLAFDLLFFTSWPTELTYLQLLSNLTLTNIQQTNLDFDAFDTLRNTLKYLHIKFSRLSKIPISICHLDKLSVLEFSHNSEIHLNVTWVEISCKSLSNLSMVNLENNNLRSLPRFPFLFNIEEIRLGHNHLSYIDTKYFSNYTDRYTKTLILSYNNFKRIPSIVSGVLPHLTYLDMQYNDILSIEETDFFMGYGLTNLQHLILNGNPIEYISFGVLQRTPALKTLELGNTRLRVLPDLKSFSSLQYVNLQSNPTDCSCKVSYLKNWNVTGIHITGYCDNSPMSVKSFLLIDLPLCQ